MHVAVALFGLATLAYAALVAGLYWQQERLLFPASSVRSTAPRAGLEEVEDIILSTSDGERLVAWWKPPQPGRALVLYFHGNGGSLWNRRERAQALIAEGRGLLIVSYRGYSGSTGRPSEAGLRLDAEAAYRFLSSFESKRIVLYGESLGTGVAVRLASEHSVGGVILDAPFTSIVDVARPLFWFVPIGLLLKDQFRSLDRIARIEAPLIVLHGERDGIIPIALAELLYEAAHDPKEFVRLPGVDHVSVLEGGGLLPVRRFLDGVEARLAVRRSEPERVSP